MKRAVEWKRAGRVRGKAKGAVPLRLTWPAVCRSQLARAATAKARTSAQGPQGVGVAVGSELLKLDSAVREQHTSETDALREALREERDTSNALRAELVIVTQLLLKYEVRPLFERIPGR